MRVIGKLLGACFGFLMGGPFGLLLGLFIGHRFDVARRGVSRGFSPFKRGQQQADQSAFFHDTFAVMGHVAKAKGHVTQQEIEVANAIMNRMGLAGESRQMAQAAFRDGKESSFPLDSTLEALRQRCANRGDLLQFFVEVQIKSALADGEIHPAERQLLHKIARILGFSEHQLERHLQMHEAAFRFQQGGGFHGYQQQYQQQNPQASRDQLSDAYKVLGVSENDDGPAIKRAYRKQMNEHHPDKLAAKGLPPEMMELAKQKTQELQMAYEVIRKAKGFK
jgi:DnaJ like chaperone protein